MERHLRFCWFIENVLRGHFRTGVFPDNFVKLIVEEDKRDRKPSRYNLQKNRTFKICNSITIFQAPTSCPRREVLVGWEASRQLCETSLGRHQGSTQFRESQQVTFYGKKKELKSLSKTKLIVFLLYRSPGSSEKLRGSEERLVSRFDGRSSEKRKSRRSGEESGSGDRLISGSSRKNSSNSKALSSNSSSKLLQGGSAASPPKSSSAALTNSSKTSAAPSFPGIPQKKEASESSSRLEVNLFKEIKCFAKN